MTATLRAAGLALLVLLSLPLFSHAVSESGAGGTLVSTSLLQGFLLCIPQVAAVLGLGVCVALSSTRATHVGLGLKALLLDVPEERRLDAAAALSTLARALWAVGLVISLLCALAGFFLIGFDPGAPAAQDPDPSRVATVLQWSMVGASVGLAGARVWIAPTADALAARAGSTERTFRPLEDLGLLIVIAPVVLTILRVVLHVPGP